MNDPSQWHSIRPWRPSLSLAVREITSVSATFILSSPLGPSDFASVEQSLASLGITNDEDEDASEGNGSSRGVQIVSDVLSKGLSVKVNGTPWQRVLMKIDDEADQAVIILFGLMPGRQYDVELGIVPTESSLRSQITTDTAPRPSESDGVADLSFVSDIAEQSDQALSIANSQSDPNGTAIPPHSNPSDAPTPSPSFSLEDRRMQLNHTLSVLTAEHATLTSTLKSARRDAQKADAALRAEIDALKRASERSAPAELRARQKARALQEAARQALAAAEQVQARVQELEESLPELVQRRVEVEREWERVHAEAGDVRRRREEAELRERKRVEAKQAELAGLAGRMERLSTRREKLEGPGGTLGELEEKLRRLEEERERIESDPYGYTFEEPVEGEQDASQEDEHNTHAQIHISPGRSHSHGHTTHHSHPRKRHSHPTNHQRGAQAPIARPEPIQRPGHGGRTNQPSGPGVIHLQSGNSCHAHTSSLPAVKRTPPSNAGSSTSGSSTNPSPAPPNASHLSSRAPPFEPRGIKSDLNPGSSPFESRIGGLAVGVQGHANVESLKKTPGTGKS
ncbi:uncharacterized protein PHACADRAFT_194616 [Phanerochaete carnosa HHB-10118-sp]|uniref:Uncharacterized protein n=1 Tax=Phanerochaete carnosa (strain HHB-10118-sp) TaxID=650164 RepID=K5V393_PHACS|nr:uncharacterized protein PHACADRAFT_194616 [Phanerochaete carnosa HHB-10118-sp]EKM57041.1 hypothetical protein PHACADRAFT_194616 [Phanerochaete carnosa HHB-10118-sp]